MTILFLHGWQSVPGGVKPTYLKDHGHTVINPKLPDEDFDEDQLRSDAFTQWLSRRIALDVEDHLNEAATP